MNISCPHCGVPTPSLKTYRMMGLFLFLGVAAVARGMTHTACPRCMRRKVVIQTLINIIPANVAMLFVLPLHTAIWLATFTRGHSRAVRKLIDELNLADIGSHEKDNEEGPYTKAAVEAELVSS